MSILRRYFSQSFVVLFTSTDCCTSQIMRPLMHICGELIEHRGVKRARDGTGFVPPVAKKPKRGGGGGAGRVYEEVPGWA